MTQASTARRMFLAHSLVLPALLAGCAGGGSDGGPSGAALAPAASTQPPATTRPLVLTLQGDQEVVVGAQLSNPATSGNGRAVTYRSSDSRIATVTDTGRVDTLMRGTVTITATESGADGQSASFKVNVLPAVLKGRFIDGTTITSTHTGVTYPYTVYLPASYASGSRRYPVIYITDGQWSANTYQEVDKRGKEVILVMIQQGPDTPDMNAGPSRRMIDYMGPGAPAYLRFMKEEMAPLIESTYRINGDRTYFGVSGGGTLGVIDMFIDPVGTPFFNRYVLTDPAIWKLTPENYMQEETRFKTNPSLPVTVLMTGSPQANGPQTVAYVQRLRSRQYQGLTLQLMEYNVPHEEMGGPTWDEALNRYF